MKKTIISIILLSLVICFLSFNIAQADDDKGLVPCKPGECKFCDLMVLGQNVIDFLLTLIFPISALMIIIGGIMIMTAAGSVERAAKGRQIIKAAITGLIIALISWLALDTIFRAANGDLKLKDNWYKIGKNISC